MLHFEFLSLTDWVKWNKGDRYPLWADKWRVVEKGVAVFEGDFNGCFHYLQDRMDGVER